jgi:hypothetical protein
MNHTEMETTENGRATGRLLQSKIACHCNTSGCPECEAASLHAQAVATAVNPPAQVAAPTVTDVVGEVKAGLARLEKMVTTIAERTLEHADSLAALTK